MSTPVVSSVLIVDDEQFFRLVLRTLLEEAGFTVAAESADGADSVIKFKEFVPTLVFMDIYMPVKNGIEALREIISLNPAAKIIICSGTGYDDDIAAALQAGARGVIFKPFYDEEVMETFKNVLAC